MSPMRAGFHVQWRDNISRPRGKFYDIGDILGLLDLSRQAMVDIRSGRGSLLGGGATHFAQMWVEQSHDGVCALASCASLLIYVLLLRIIFSSFLFLSLAACQIS